MPSLRWAGGALALAVVARAARREELTLPGSDLGARAFAAALLLSLAAAAAFRLVRLASVPPGLYLDEVLTARNALLSRGSGAPWWGSTPLRDAGWVETSNLYLRAMSAVLRLGGDGLVGVRLMSVLPSLACVVLTGVLGARLLGRTAGALAAFLLAISHWAARTGRTGWDEVAMTALQLAALALLARALETGRALPAALAGACLGLALHTYVASRLVVASAAVLLAWEYARAGRRAETLRLALACLGAAAVVAAPFLAYQWSRDAGAFGARTSELLMPGLTTKEGLHALLLNVVMHLGMFNGQGGAYARDDLPGAPMLDPLTGVLFLAGLAAVARLGGWRFRLLVSWAAVCALGGILSSSREGPPYVYRVANLAPWACLVAAAGAAALVARARPAAARAGTRPAIAAAVLSAAALANAWILFAGTARCPDFAPAFGTVETRLGLWLARHPGARPFVASADAFRALDAYRATLWLPDVNGQSWYRPEESIAAVQLVSGLWAREPAHARRPAAPNDRISLSAEPRCEAPCVLAVPPPQAPLVRASAKVAAEETLVDSLGRELCTVLTLSR